MTQTSDGALRLHCNQCRAKGMAVRFHGPEAFLPVQNPRKAASYGAALEALGRARVEQDGEAFVAARETIAVLALKTCVPCRASNVKSQANPSTKYGACRVEAQRLKTEVFHTCGRCGATRAVEANHRPEFAANKKAYEAMVKTHGREAAEAAYPASERKLYGVFEPSYWNYNGGVEGMRAESTKCGPDCCMCHQLDDSSTTAPQNAGGRAKAAAKDYETKKQRTTAIRLAGYREDKRAFVNAIKRKIGVCENPACPCDGPSGGRCVAGFEVCYDNDHIDPRTKGRSIGAIVTERSSLTNAKAEILAELGLPPDFDVDTDPIPPMATRRCRLLCRNCHNTRKAWDHE